MASDPAEEPRHGTAPGVHEAVLEMMEKSKKGRVLDAGAGEGALTKRLLDMGFDVEACDLDPDRFKVSSINCRNVDLNEDLPYESKSFDYVISIETIEHLHDPWHLISECGRILRKDGWLILTTPNIMSITSRLRFFLFGEFSYFRHIELWREPEDTIQKLDKHINPVPFTELEYVLSKNGLLLEEIAISKHMPKATSSPVLLISALAYPFVKAVVEKRFGKESPLSSYELLRGVILVTKARKK